LLAYHTYWEASDSVKVLAFFGFTGSTTSKVRLMLSALGMGEVRAIVLVDGKTEAAFEGTNVILEASRFINISNLRYLST